MKKQKSKKSIPEKILELESFLKVPRTAEEIKKELKDYVGYAASIAEIRKSLLRLLRRKKIKRKKEKNTYQYHI